MSKTGYGSKFGKWFIISQEPQKGGNSCVWEVKRDDTEDTIHAIKLLNSNQFKYPRYQRFKDEVQYVTSNPDEGILPIIDFNLPDKPSEKNRPWYVMPLANPVTHLINLHKSRLESIIEIILPIARTLMRLHNKNVSHRDIKPDNILSFDGKPVISDFGLVDYPDKIDVTLSLERMGPAFFIAPELMGNATDVDARPGDVYSLAKSIWVLVSNKQWPFPGRLDIGDIRLRLSTYCPHKESIFIDRILDISTRTSPDSRPTMQEFVDELSHWIELITMTNEEKLPKLNEMKKHFSAIASASAKDVAKDHENKQAAKKAFDLLQPFIQKFFEKIAKISSGKVDKSWAFYKYPKEPPTLNLMVTRRDGLTSEVRLILGSYCEKANFGYDGLGIQIHIVAFDDSTTEFCMALFTSTGEIHNRTSSSPGIPVIGGNPRVSFCPQKNLWFVHEIEKTSSASLATTLKKVGKELNSKIEMALQELRDLIESH